MVTVSPANKKRTYKKLQAAIRDDIFFFMRNLTACLFFSLIHEKNETFFIQNYKELSNDKLYNDTIQIF